MLALALVGAAGAARADATPAADGTTTLARSRTPSPRVEWTWPRFRWWEYAGTAGVYVADAWVRFHEPPPDHPRWIGQNPFDDTIAGRARPSTPDCAANPGYDALCGDIANNASFPSGHVLTIATAAGLVCVHHRYLPLYGSEAADAGACALLTAATAATGVARIVADRHFATDMLIGATIGFGSGYGLPWLLHYRAGRALDAGGEGRAVMLLPLAGPNMLGLSVAGVGAP
ncbi:MAG TPA: phosphatase PAP2 family protein [Polyangia bacterium]|nr:phosphatase PAP2 family protein [Polyangia bacterium]